MSKKPGGPVSPNYLKNEFCGNHAATHVWFQKTTRVFKMRNLWGACCPIFSICNGCPESLRRMRLTITLKLSGSLHALQPSQALRLGDWGTGVRGCGWRLEFQSFKPSLQQAENVAQNKHTSSLWSFSRKTPKLFQAKSMTRIIYSIIYNICIICIYIHIYIYVC